MGRVAQAHNLKSRKRCGFWVMSPGLRENGTKWENAQFVMSSTSRTSPTTKTPRVYASYSSPIPMYLSFDLLALRRPFEDDSSPILPMPRSIFIQNVETETFVCFSWKPTVDSFLAATTLTTARPHTSTIGDTSPFFLRCTRLNCDRAGRGHNDRRDARNKALKTTTHPCPPRRFFSSVERLGA